MKVAVSIFIIIICISFIIDYVCVYKAEKTDDDQQEKWIRDYSIRKNPKIVNEEIEHGSGR